MEDLNLNQKSYKILQGFRDYDGVETTEFSIGGKKATVIDLGVRVKIDDKLSKKIGISVAEATMGSLGKVGVVGDKLGVDISEYPAIATLGCQLAGWSIEVEGKKKLGSGPARIPAGKPSEIIDRVGYHESSEKSTLILETDTLPGKDTCKKILKDTKSRELIIAALRDDTTIGLINVLARIVEVGIFRLNNLGYDVNTIVSASGSVPVPKITPDVMFTSNDSIIYRGMVSLEVNGWDPEITERAVSRSSGVYGKSFKEIFEEAGGNFYKIDPEIFAPAGLNVTDLKDGRKYRAGGILSR
jgi:methenyltetrahydromethanopterin cyclohydrolase